MIFIIFDNTRKIGGLLNDNSLLHDFHRQHPPHNSQSEVAHINKESFISRWPRSQVQSVQITIGRDGAPDLCYELIRVFTSFSGR